MTVAPRAETVPRLLHFIWLGSPLPPNVIVRIEKFRSLNPECEIRIWSNDDLDWLTNRREYHRANTWQGRADIARYEILYRHGGYYFDTDFEPQKSLTSIFELAREKTMVLCTEKLGTFSNAFMGAAPNSPPLWELIQELPRRIQSMGTEPANVCTGPSLVTSFANEWLKEANEDIAIVPRDWLYPYSFDKLDRGEGPWSECVVAAHGWAAASDGPAIVARKFRQGTLDKYLNRLKGFARRIFNGIAGFPKRLVTSRRYRPNALYVDAQTAITVDRAGFPLAFSPADLDVVAHLLVDGVYDPHFHSFIRRVLSGSDTYVDVGANIGQFVVTAASCLSDYGRVFAFEPNPNVFKLLETNVYMNQMRGSLRCEVKFKQVALGEALGSTTLRIPQNHAGRGTITRSALADIPASKIQSVDVSVDTLDRLIGSLSHVRLLKIDVEGAEFSVLAGARELIERQLIDYIDIEFKSSHLGSSLNALMDLLETWVSQGARLWTLGRNGRLRMLETKYLRGERISLSHVIIQMPRVTHETW